MALILLIGYLFGAIAALGAAGVMHDDHDVPLRPAVALGAILALLGPLTLAAALGLGLFHLGKNFGRGARYLLDGVTDLRDMWRARGPARLPGARALPPEEQ